jgi:hypothetical protein
LATTVGTWRLKNLDYFHGCFQIPNKALKRVRR